MFPKTPSHHPAGDIESCFKEGPGRGFAVMLFFVLRFARLFCGLLMGPGFGIRRRYRRLNKRAEFSLPMPHTKDAFSRMRVASWV
jgi:hypothetical protein